MCEICRRLRRIARTLYNGGVANKESIQFIESCGYTRGGLINEFIPASRRPGGEMIEYLKYDQIGQTFVTCAEKDATHKKIWIAKPIEKL